MECIIYGCCNKTVALEWVPIFMHLVLVQQATKEIIHTWLKLLQFFFFLRKGVKLILLNLSLLVRK